MYHAYMSKVKVNGKLFKELRNCLNLTQQNLASAAGIATKTVHNIENGVYQVTNGTYSKIKNFFLSPEVVNNLVKSGWMFNTSSDDVIDFISAALVNRGPSNVFIKVNSPFTELDMQSSIVSKISHVDYYPSKYDPYLIDMEKKERYSNIQEKDYVIMQKKALDTSLKTSYLKDLYEACLKKNVIWKQCADFGGENQNKDSSELEILRRLSKIIEDTKLNFNQEATSLNSLTDSIENENKFYDCYSELQTQGFNTFLGWQVLNSGRVPIIFIVDSSIKELGYSIKELHPRLYVPETEMPFNSFRVVSNNIYELTGHLYTSVNKDDYIVPDFLLPEDEKLWVKACEKIVEENFGGEEKFMKYAHNLGYNIA